MVHLLPGPLLTLAVFLSLVPWMESEGRPQLIGSSQPIRAPLGSDVILPCIVQPERNMEEMTVRWWRPDVPPDPRDPKSDYRYVHLYPENQHQEDLTMPSYVWRTEMFADGLKLGNLSLRIRKLKASDDGRYRCIIRMLRIDTTIMLEVFEPISDDTLTTAQFPGNLQTPDPKNETDVKVGRHNWSSWFVVLAFCVLVVLAVGRFLKHKYQRRHFSVHQKWDSDLQHLRKQVDRPGKQHLETQCITVRSKDLCPLVSDEGRAYWANNTSLPGSKMVD